MQYGFPPINISTVGALINHIVWTFVEACSYIDVSNFLNIIIYHESQGHGQDSRRSRRYDSHIITINVYWCLMQWDVIGGYGNRSYIVLEFAKPAIILDGSEISITKFVVYRRRARCPQQESVWYFVPFLVYSGYVLHRRKTERRHPVNAALIQLVF